MDALQRNLMHRPGQVVTRHCTDEGEGVSYDVIGCTLKPTRAGVSGSHVCCKTAYTVTAGRLLVPNTDNLYLQTARQRQAAILRNCAKQKLP